MAIVLFFVFIEPSLSLTYEPSGDPLDEAELGFRSDLLARFFGELLNLFLVVTETRTKGLYYGSL